MVSFTYGDIQKSGRMKAACERSELPPPELEFDDYNFSITINGPKVEVGEVGEAVGVPVKTSASTGDFGERFGVRFGEILHHEEVNEGVKARLEKELLFLSEHGHIRRPEMEGAFRISTATAERDLALLRRLGLIVLGYRFRDEEIIVVLYRELAGVEIKTKGIFGFGTLKFRTLRHGDFSLAWAVQHPPYHGASYKLWISTSRIVPAQEGGRGFIWVRPSILKFGYKSDPNLARYLPTSQLDYISAIHRIQFEVRDGENGIAAIFRDLLLHSETMDIIRTLEVLRQIESRL